MTPDIVAHPDTLPARPEPTGPPSIIEIISAATMSRDVDVAKLRELVELHKDMERHAAEREFKAAMARLQAKMPRITRRGVIMGRDREVRSRFAPIEDLDAVIRPLLAEEGFSVDWNTEDKADKMTVVGRASHRQGHSETRQLTLVRSTPPGASATQGDGSTLSYGKRQVLKMLFNIVEENEDNDGAGDDGLISAEQALEIDNLIAKTRSDRVKFCEHFGVANTNELLARDLGRALNMLDAKARASVVGAKR